MTSNRAVTVFGAYGHTGRFVVAELCRRGCAPILSGRDTGKLEAFGAEHPTLERRVASVEDPASLNRAIDGAVAVINCAGPFLDTATPVVEAALRARIHYLDITAEQRAALDVFERHGDAARSAGITVLPGMAFYGGWRTCSPRPQWMTGSRPTTSISVSRSTVGTPPPVHA
jgi:short subunit dehydrogenase-like uncharacterized protein